MRSPELEILLPIHNEAESIEATIRELYEELSPRISVAFILCEDGRCDNTRQIVRRLAEEIPMRLNVSDEYRGYSRAVREGMEMLQAEWVLCVDSYGHCDPKDFWKFWQARHIGDVLLGWRADRQDMFARRAMSRFFYGIYLAVFRAPGQNPSCPFVLCRRATAQDVANQLGEMKQGFWWEFVARVHHGGCSIVELPVKHRLRAGGVTRLDQGGKMPGIFVRHVAAIFKIWAQTRAAGVNISHSVSLPQKSLATGVKV